MNTVLMKKDSIEACRDLMAPDSNSDHGSDATDGLESQISVIMELMKKLEHLMRELRDTLQACRRNLVSEGFHLAVTSYETKMRSIGEQWSADMTTAGCSLAGSMVALGGMGLGFGMGISEMTTIVSQAADKLMASAGSMSGANESAEAKQDEALSGYELTGSQEQDAQFKKLVDTVQDVRTRMIDLCQKATDYLTKMTDAVRVH